jgi:hypothetical protein
MAGRCHTGYAVSLRCPSRDTKTRLPVADSDANVSRELRCLSRFGLNADANFGCPLDAIVKNLVAISDCPFAVNRRSTSYDVGKQSIT